MTDSDDDAGTVAPIALTTGTALPEKPQEKKALSETQMQDEVVDALKCFFEMNCEADPVITEKEMGDLQKDCTKMVGACRRKSLVHMAKKLSDLNGKLGGAKLVLTKARAYRKKPSDVSSKPLVTAVETAKKKHELPEAELPLWIRSDLLGIESERMYRDGDLNRAVDSIAWKLAAEALESTEASTQFQDVWVFKLFIKYLQDSEKNDSTGANNDIMRGRLDGIVTHVTGSRCQGEDVLCPKVREHFMHLKMLLSHKTDPATEDAQFDVQRSYRFAKEQASTRTVFIVQCSVV